jgi:hypothetical protein
VLLRRVLPDVDQSVGPPAPGGHLAAPGACARQELHALDTLHVAQPPAALFQEMVVGAVDLYPEHASPLARWTPGGLRRIPGRQCRQHFGAGEDARLPARGADRADQQTAFHRPQCNAPLSAGRE